MAGHVGQRFLHDTVGGGFGLRREARGDSGVTEIYTNPRGASESLDEAEYCRQEAELIEVGGTQIGRNAAHAVQNLVDHFLCVAEPRAKEIRNCRILSQQESQAGEELADFVMEFARQMTAFELLNLAELARQAGRHWRRQKWGSSRHEDFAQRVS